MPVISIIIPVHNTAPWLPACLDSILAQTFQDFECICVNDGSTDDSSTILARYAEADPRIRVLSQENQGVSIARNNGVRLATSAYVGFVDGDDYIHPQMLEALHDRIKPNRADVVACCYQRVTGVQATTPLDLSRMAWKTVAPPLHARLQRSPRIRVEDYWGALYACGKLFRRELLDRHPFVAGIVHGEDAVFMNCLLHDVNVITLTMAKLYYYRMVSTSVTQTTFNAQKVSGYLDGIRVVYDFYAQAGDPRVLKLIRATAIRDFVRILLKSMVRECPNGLERLQLFNGAQPRIRSMMKTGMISYQGLRWRHRLVLFLLANYPHARYATRVGTVLWRSRQAQRPTSG